VQVGEVGRVDARRGGEESGGGLAVHFRCCGGWLVWVGLGWFGLVCVVGTWF
jgi:hypothetical protein